MTDNSKRTGAAVEAHYRFLLWLVPTIEKFPRAHKFTVGERIESKRSPDGAKRNPGSRNRHAAPRITLTLHPGYFAL
jgi:hypothetical protein